jgi:deazaflavin-dependent oxidoreductase (nitroreductase family)
MMRKMLLTLKSRAESSETSRLTMPVGQRADHAAEVEAADSRDRGRKPVLGLRRQPGRMALALFRLPQPLYRRGWGWLLGDTFLLLIHSGRKTGKPHATVAMTLSHDLKTHEAVVCSAWGEAADWIRNIQVHPALRVRIGRESFTPEQRFLTEDESFAVAVEFRRRHPWRLRLLTWILGWGDLRSDVAVRDFVHTRPFVSFRPAQPSRL